MAFTPYNAGLARLRWYCCKLYQAAAAMSLFFDQNYGRLYCNLQIMLLPLIRFWSYQRGDLLMQPAPSQIPLCAKYTENVGLEITVDFLELLVKSNTKLKLYLSCIIA